MLTIDSYRDVLSENAGRSHGIGSAWALLGLLGAVLVMFA